MSPGGRLAVVVPAIDEADRLPELLTGLAALDAEVVVSDGGSIDGTRSVARSHGARVVTSAPGRARQLRTGVEATDAEWLLFLHADCRVTPAAATAIRDFVDRAGTEHFAHFRFALDGDRLGYRLIEIGQRARERLTGLVYGDQGLLVSRELYEGVGGVPEWPLLEDVGLLERLGAVGTREAFSAPLPTSARRYETEGVVRGWLRNVAIISLYRLGMHPEAIARRFPRRRHRARDPEEERIVIVFAKAPRPGEVKTRLAADVGAEEATRIYRHLGRATVDALRGGPFRVVVYHDPPDAADELGAWLGEGGVALRPQRGSELGARMEAAFEECLAEADRVCIVGTDIPGLGSETAREAFAALDDADVVVGPATDGGYYLLGLRRPISELFQNVAWSTESVLETTLARAAEIGARVHLLAEMTDVDRASDLPPGLRSA